MNSIIEQILSETGHNKVESPVQFYSNDDKSFFFILNLTEGIFSTLLDKDLINENEEYKKILDGFKSIVNDGEQLAIEKNSSLIILVHCDDIIAIETLKQQILLLEEDEYFFKKYVIMYTDDSISGLSERPIVESLRAKVQIPVILTTRFQFKVST